MKKLIENRYAFGAVAGLASALLLVAGQHVAFFSAMFLILSFAAIIAAGLAAGAMASVIAILCAGGIIAATMGSGMAVLNIALTLAPAALMAWLANFARPAEEIGGPARSMAWYPLSDMLLYTAIAVAASSYLVLLINPLRDVLQGEIFNQVKLMMSEMSPDLVLDAAAEQLMRTLIAILLPLTQAGQLVLFIFAAYYFALRFLDTAKLALRPREDIPAALRMHPAASILLLGGILSMFAGGELAIAGANLVGAFGACFVMAGFAVFHLYARGKSWALPGMILAYLVTFLFSIPILVFMAIGMLNTRRSIAVTPRDNSTNPDI